MGSQGSGSPALCGGVGFLFFVLVLCWSCLYPLLVFGGVWWVGLVWWLCFEICIVDASIFVVKFF